jgi:predicted transcriptional regulator
MKEELTQWEIETIIVLQNGLKKQVIENPIPSLIKKGYVKSKDAGKAELTQKGENFKI